MQVRCLLSRADPAVKRTKVRETQYSVEAISLDGAQSWIGINQCHVTRCPSQVPSHVCESVVPMWDSQPQLSSSCLACLLSAHISWTLSAKWTMLGSMQVYRPLPEGGRASINLCRPGWIARRADGKPTLQPFIFSCSLKPLYALSFQRFGFTVPR